MNGRLTGCIIGFIVAVLLTGCGENSDNVVWGGIALGFLSLQSEQPPPATQQERNAYAHKQAADYWSKVRDTEHPNGYKVDERNWPIGYYED